jgi:hypothetical protein
MTRQNANMAASAALAFAVIAVIFLFESAGHPTRILAAAIGVPVLLIAAIALFAYGRTLKS